MTALLAIAMAVGAMLACVLLFPLAGAASGWLVGAVFSESMGHLMAVLGWPGEAWQLGAMLGFVAAFLPRMTCKTEKKSWPTT